MSTITIQVGQCGNQVGAQLFSKISDVCFHKKKTGLPMDGNIKFIDETAERFFIVPEAKNERMRARAILVDTEAKVVTGVQESVRRSSEMWEYGASDHFYQQRGAGNNWAQGYKVYGPQFEAELKDLVRRQVEACDHLTGFLTLGSVAGGTGSGLGAYICEMIRDDYEHALILSQVVWPYQAGEVIVQNYNAILSVAHLSQSVDGLLIMENDWLQKICSTALNLANISMTDLNGVVAEQLASLLLPVTGAASGIGGVLEAVHSGVEHKLLSLRSAPIISPECLDYTTYTWSSYLNLLTQQLLNNSFCERGLNWKIGLSQPARAISRSVANLLVLRGKGCEAVDVSLLEQPGLYVPWVPAKQGLTVWRHPRYFHRYECLATLLTNGQSSVRAMDRVVDKAWQMFAAGAYLHRYNDYGLEESEFMDCFATVEHIIASYKQL